MMHPDDTSTESSLRGVYEHAPPPEMAGFDFTFAGDASYTCRPLYRVVCRRCGDEVHRSTTAPLIRARQHLSDDWSERKCHARLDK